jgi:aminopeptidase N
MEDWRQFHSAVIESYRDSKDADELVTRIFAQYRFLDASDRSEINRLIDRDLADADGQHRYDYLALIQEFRVTSANGGLRRLVDRLAGMPGPEALAEREKVIRLAQELGN